MQAASDHPPFGALLRRARTLRRLSQLDLALQAEVSQRHLSCLESGRSRPSREMVLQIAVALDLSMRERNRLLHAAGFVGEYAQRSIEAADMRPVREALQHMLRQQEPYPGVVVDRAWNLLEANRAMQALLGLAGDVEAMWQRVCGDGPRNILQLTLHPEGLASMIVNLDDLAPLVLARTAREALEYPEVQPVLDAVLAYPELPRAYRRIDLQDARLPVVPTHLRLGGTDLRLFTMLASFGTPLDVTTDELRLELFFPADAESQALLEGLAAATAAR